MSKKLKSPLEKFLRKRAKELQSDWEDVPMWVVEACNEFIAKSTISPNDNSIEIANQYLSNCESDEDTINAIKAIASHEDQGAFIDYVDFEKFSDSVGVWQKVENTITCQEFLEMINYSETNFK